MNLEELLKIQNLMIEQLTAGSGLPGLVGMLAQICAKPMIITNASLCVLGVSRSNEILEGSSVLLEPSLGESGSCTLKLNDDSWPAWSNKVYGPQKRLLGCLFILDAEVDIRIQTIMKHAARLCALEFTKNNQVLNAQREYKDAFIYDLLYSNIDEVKDIVNRGEIWGWNLNRPHCVLVFELEEYEVYTTDQHLLDTLLDLVESVMQQDADHPIIMQKKGQIIAILPIDIQPNNSKVCIMRLGEQVLSRAKLRLARRRLNVGVGRVYASPDDIFKSYQEAKVALELGKLMGIDSTIPFFSDLGLDRILYHHDLQELKEFYKETLGVLESYDEEQGNELMGSLEQYLLNQCNLKATAISLYLHPNTLRYRLKKIEEILQTHLDDFDTKLNLMTAFKIKYLKKV
ncbi:PucR family transcriptional regulator [Desulfosporosinus fructosivorans]